MRRAERLFRLVQELRQRPIARAEDLARAMEVGTRTIYRDIAHLQASGLPIEGAAGVGYLVRPGFTLPPVAFTHEQLDALAIGLSLAESLDDPALATAAREARAKLQAVLPDPATGTLTGAPFLALRRTTGAPRHAAIFREAIRKRRVLDMTYADAAGQPTRRRIRPLAIWSLAEGWMVTAWCELRDGFRTFRLDRIGTLAASGETFRPEAGKTLQDFLAAEACEPAAS